MHVAIKQVRGGSGVDVWAENLCQGLNQDGQGCSVNLYSPTYQFLPFLARLHPVSSGSDLIHSNTPEGFVFKEELPLVVTEHHVVNDPAYDPYRTLPQKIYHRWIYRCERKTLDVADAVTCVSRFTQKKIEEVFGYTGSRLIYNGVDTTVFRPVEQNFNRWNIPPDKTVLFFAGNLSRRKGADLLPAIMKHLGENYILIVATGQREIAFGHLKNIINIGHLDLMQLVTAYNRCDIFLSASRLEGFGLSVAEAMACGKPIIATNGSSLPELVVDGKGGFLCEMDNIHDFVKKILALSGDEQSQKIMGEFNRDRVLELFTLEEMVHNYIGLYRSLV
jgi:glycosyltransferase involved in cell wall biosynthesis